MSDSINSNNKQHYSKFVVDNSNPLGDGRIEIPLEQDPDLGVGQVKYAKCIGKDSIYKDETRSTENDKLASKKAEGSMPDPEGDEYQGGMY